jgi:hypothetical protein
MCLSSTTSKHDHKIKRFLLPMVPFAMEFNQLLHMRLQLKTKFITYYLNV